MIKADDFRKPCGCRSVGECHHNTFAECDAFDAVVDAFAKEMKAKFRRKWREGRGGWDDPNCYEGMRIALQEHAARPLQHVDVANFAAMLWNLGDPRSPSPTGDVGG